MAIKREVVTTADGKDITVTEVRVRRIMTVLPFLQPGKKNDQPRAEDVQKSFAENARDLLRDCCGLTVEQLQDLYPSEIEDLWQAFKKVNSFFFKTAERLGVAEQLGAVIRSVLDGCGEQLASSLKEDISAALTTASLSSSPPPNTPGSLEAKE